MRSIDSSVITRKLNVDLSFRPLKKKRRKFASKKKQVINEEVDWLEANDMI